MNELEFRIQDILPIGFTLVVAGIGLAYGLDVSSDIQADMTTNSLEYNATGNMMTGVSNISAKFPTLGTILVATIIIGVLITYLFVRT